MKIANKIFYIIVSLLIFLTPLQADETKKSGLPQFDVSTYSQQIFWLILNFLVIYLFLTYIVIPKIQNIKLARKHKTLGQLEKAIAIKKEIEKILQEDNKINKKTNDDCSAIFNEINDKITTLSHIKTKELEEIKKKEQQIFDEKMIALRNTSKSKIDQSTQKITVAILDKLNLSHLSSYITK